MTEEARPSKRILVIDDDQEINDFLKIKFKKYDYQVETTTDIETFFKKVVEFKPTLCLVDLNLGDYDGFGYKIVELMRRKIGDDIIIIVMSRRNSEADITMALELGANDYVQKPIDEYILLSKTEVFLGNAQNITNFPYYSLPSGDSECYFHIPMKITQVSEESLYIYSHEYIAKGSLIELESDLLNGCKFAIKDVNLDREKKGYILRVDLDEIEHAHLMPIIRKFMIKAPPLEE